MQNGLSELVLGESVLSLPVSSDLLWIGLGVIAILTAIISAILFYHWSAYGYHRIRTTLVGIIYGVGVVILLGVILTGIISYIATL